MATTKIPLKELGPRLPLGVPGPDGQLQKEIACKPWRGREEREVGQLRGQSREDHDFPTKLLAYMFERVGPHDFTAMSMPEREVVISQMFFGDGLYAYVWLRTQCIGHEIKLDLTCPSCSFEFKYAADLNTIEVRTADDLEAVKWEYELKNPFDLRGKKASAFELAPSRWSTIQRAAKASAETGGMNANATKMEILQSSVAGVPGVGPIVLTGTELDDMTKLDIEELAGKIDGHEVGPDMLVSEKCPRCRRRVRVSLDWDYASFFESSSQ